MKLGIAVVYLLDAVDEKLLDLHLSQIEGCTPVDYTLYASVNRLSDRLRPKLEQHPRVRICECPTTELRGAPEHSFYLERLVESAIQEGVTHLVTLHVDSFPLRSDWVANLDAQLSDSVALATVSPGPYTSCLFFRREFYINHHPRFLLSDDECASPTYTLFSRQFKHILHSGIGYMYRAYADGLTWYPLTESKLDSGIGTVYQDLIFHLNGTARLSNAESREDQILRNPRFVRLLYQARRLSRAIFPARIRSTLWERFGDPLEQMVDQPVFEYAKKQLLENPEAYLSHLRKSK